jgi:hypothetical protein
MQAMDLKYQLPSDPTVYVDLLDDEDVQLMFDEVGLKGRRNTLNSESQGAVGFALNWWKGVKTGRVDL